MFVRMDLRPRKLSFSVCYKLLSMLLGCVFFGFGPVLLPIPAITGSSVKYDLRFPVSYPPPISVFLHPCFLKALALLVSEQKT